MKRVMKTIEELWRTDAALTGTAILMLGAFLAAIIGLAIDPRVITGLPAWMKPAKFAISTAIFMLTMAWIFTYLPAWVRTRRVVGRGTAAILILEVAIIYIQAWRGTTSHFNASTPLDTVMFATMGLAIGVQTVLTAAAAVALWRQPFADRALGWALRLGIVISIVGASTGGLMVTPTDAQRAEAAVTHRLPVSGAHTVGAADGGPGLPALGWSREHGDLRVPHFLGLHALQAIPFLVLLIRRRMSIEAARVGWVFVISLSYCSLFAILLWQALRGQSILRFDGATAATLAAWAIITATAAYLTIVRRDGVQRPKSRAWSAVL